MNLKLTRTGFRQDGVFGLLYDEGGNLICYTLEHAYEGYGPGSAWVPKVAAGTYRCVRHAPAHLPYETFLLENVPDFKGKKVTGILIHRGNQDKDSEGCILVGQTIAQSSSTQQILLHSTPAFERIMDFQDGCDSFQLVIS